jgi:hypothetical protein
MQRSGFGAAIGGAAGGVVSKAPQAAKFVNDLSGGKIGNALKPIGDKITNSKLYDALMTDVRAFDPNKQTAYHGSPYDFNKFSNEAIGTGEGAQAHGYGHYSALNKDVAEGYADRLGHYSLDNPNKIALPYGTDTDIIQANYFGKEEQIKRLQNQIEIQKDLLKTDPDNSFAWQAEIDHLNTRINNLNKYYDKFKLKADKQLYKLSIPKDDVMLREGATFAQQPKKVQEAIKSIVKENPELAEVIDTRTADEFFEIAQNKLGKKGKNIMKEVFDAELSGDENKIINAWDKYNEFESKNPNITRTDFDPNEIYGYLKNYKDNGVDETGRLFQNQYSNTNLYKYLEDEKNLNKALYDNGIKGISYNGGIDGEARVIFNPDDIVIGRKYYNQPNLYEQLTGKQNTGALVDALFNR